MPKFFVRAVVAIAVVGLLIGVGSMSSSVQAETLPSRVHLYHLKSWYDQEAARTRFTSFSNLNYYGGQVMPTSTTYSIFWVPSGYTVSSSYQSLLNRYFNDIGGSSFYNIVSQYYQNPNQQHIQNVSSLGATWVDTAAYPGGRGSAANPLTDADIQAEVLRAASANGWTSGNNHLFLVFTAQGVESCMDSSNCTPGTSHPVYCAYHGYFTNSGLNYAYANMPYVATWGSSCGVPTTSPNNDPAADAEISVTSHEHFEAVTDINPPPGGPSSGTTAWTDWRGYEIGDKCAYKYGTVAANGSNITLNGNPYYMQLEWSNAKRGCASS